MEDLEGYLNVLYRELSRKEGSLMMLGIGRRIGEAVPLERKGQGQSTEDQRWQEHEHWCELLRKGNKMCMQGGF